MFLKQLKMSFKPKSERITGNKWFRIFNLLIFNPQIMCLMFILKRV